ncbi:hypothetical protein [Parahaliea mediterranea]|uniref:LPXTG cell wall anchor domain-containing protein n=1 Tax=Parahaliea mediterranea TaxID=651086 RepID=A0A939DI40_9GAMM|nr:hypothetical protein [Parahaliea mediterranea]MBN7797947.1 hypothetical protein [Parahaliea mediterranea]
MLKQLTIATGVIVALGMSGQAAAQAPTCADIEWSASVKADYPDIEETCSGVYERDGKLYAQARVEVQRVRGNRITFRPLHTDGTKGDSHSINVPSTWRAKIAGRNYRASELVRGQELNVYVPNDRWALAVYDEEPSMAEEIEVIEIVAVEEVAMPTTASPLFLFGLGGGALLSLGGLLTALRRRRH